METFQLAGGAPAAYERHLVPRLFEPLAAHLLELAPPAGRVLDVACGTGVVARQAAALADTVAGIDINAAMIELARRGPFRLGDHTEAVALLRSAGFADIGVYNHCHAVRFGSVADLVEAEIDATPLAQQAKDWAPGVREAVTAAAEQALRCYTADDGLLFPMGAYVATATKS